MATGCDTQAEIIPKHKIVLFSKLDSYHVAEEKVRELLEEIVIEDNYMGECVIERYDEKTVYRDTMQFTSTTVVVVVDARQTRTIITPYQRDKAIDLWDELDLLNCQITEPKGSIIIVIYGDKDSKKLEASKLIADNRLRSWTHSDPLARDLALRGRCFSIWERFNKRQRERITQFLREQPILPNARRNADTLVFGDPSSSSVLNAYLRDHPLLNYVSGRSLKPARLHEAQYGIPSFKQGAKSPEYTFAVWYCDAIEPVKVCTEGFDLRTDFPLSASQFKEYSISNVWQMSCFSFGDIPDFDNLILVCHCGECFTTIYENKDFITGYLREELGQVGIRLHGEVIPLVSTDTGTSQEVIDKARLSVVQLARKGNGSLLEHKIGKIEREKPGSVPKLLAWYACQTAMREETGILPYSVNLFRLPTFSLESVYRGWSSAWNVVAGVVTWVSGRFTSDSDSKQAQLRQPLLEGESSIIEI